MNELNVLSLGDGMGCGKIALDNLEIETIYHAVEIDKHARLLSDDNIPGIIRPFNDVKNITPRYMLLDGPIFDLVIFGSPCQDFSKAGSNKGVDGEKSSLLFDCVSILAMAKYRNPKVKFLIENISAMSKKDMAIFNRIVGYQNQLIDSALVSGQSRIRSYWSNEKLYNPIDLNISMNDVIDLLPGEKAYSWSKSARKDGSFDERLRTDNKSPSLLASGINGTEARILITKENLDNFKPRKVWDRKELLIYNIEHRLPTIDDIKRLQTIPKDYNMGCISKTQAFKCIGNGWTVTLIEELFKNILNV